MDTPDSLALFALKTAPLPKGIRPAAGAYSVDKEFLVKVSGTFKVGEDYEQQITQTANHRETKVRKGATPSYPW